MGCAENVRLSRRRHQRRVRRDATGTGQIDFIQTRHEEMAAFMACVHAKFTGELGVCIATSGPGASHLITGLYDARMDHMPVLAIGGQQPRSAMGGHYHQELDLASMFKDVAGCFAKQASMPSQGRHLVDRAIRTALSERRVTAIILPNDLQEMPYEEPERARGTLHSGGRELIHRNFMHVVSSASCAPGASRIKSGSTLYGTSASSVPSLSRKTAAGAWCHRAWTSGMSCRCATGCQPCVDVRLRSGIGRHVDSGHARVDPGERVGYAFPKGRASSWRRAGCAPSGDRSHPFRLLRPPARERSARRREAHRPSVRPRAMASPNATKG